MTDTRGIWPDPKQTAEILAKIAQNIVAESSAEHPVDVAYAMTAGIEAAAATLEELHKRGVRW